MILALLAFLGGALTIVSPCILPVLPFVFARTGRPFVRSTLPLLGGMAATFAAVATLAAAGGGWAVRANAIGRAAAHAVLAVLALTLLSRRLADRVARPFVALGSRITDATSGTGDVVSSLVLGAATGLLWAPCAGPVLGLILAGAAIRGPSAGTTVLLAAYALGAATSLALATLAGGRVLAALKGSLGAGEWVRRALGAAVLAAVAAIALGWDTGALASWSTRGTQRLEQSLLDALPGGAPALRAAGELAGDGTLPSLDGATLWLNSSPLTRDALRGKVVLVDFWTYSCINCLRALPYVKAWDARYREHGLVVLGVHAPEFAFEKDADNVRRAVAELAIPYPVALDNDFAIWRAFDNHSWPAHYFVDALGRIRGHHFGEGEYAASEQRIRALLMEAGQRDLPPAIVEVEADGVARAADFERVASPETYIGYRRAERFVSPSGLARDTAQAYALPADPLARNDWALAGRFTVSKERAVAEDAGARIVFRFRARDLHLVLGPAPDGRPVRFRVTIDGKPPAGDAGIDVDASGEGVVREQRLYQLIRQAGDVTDRTLSIEFLDAGAQAYAFTFG
ncbi:MAG TPA: cytochrome c biogenesis protein CcdA [Myxococcota bacterium]|nr:cytochrome c biogenesis protein CcdA [Myxococcota bacterium]